MFQQWLGVARMGAVRVMCLYSCGVPLIKDFWWVRVTLLIRSFFFVARLISLRYWAVSRSDDLPNYDYYKCLSSLISTISNLLQRT